MSVRQSKSTMKQGKQREAKSPEQPGDSADSPVVPGPHSAFTQHESLVRFGPGDAERD